MFLTLMAICVVVLCLLIVIWIKRRRDRREMELHSITPEALHTLLASNQGVLLFDVRQPLDLLADSEIILGATRIPPKDLLENPLLIPKEKDSVVYCTCPSDKTSRVVTCSTGLSDKNPLTPSNSLSNLTKLRHVPSMDDRQTMNRVPNSPREVSQDAVPQYLA
jgi:rhodanese-related sulfurtransferase